MEPNVHDDAAVAMDRRSFLANAGGAGLTLMGLSGFLAACGGSSQGGGGAQGGNVQLTEFLWVGSNQDVTPKAVNSAYLKAHPGTKIDVVAGTNAETFPKIMTSIKTTPDDPLVNFGFFNSDAISKGTVADIWLPLSPSAVPNVKNVLPAFRLPGDKGVYFASSPVGLMYSTKVFKDKGWDPPTSWNDLWDPRFKGKVAFYDAPTWSFNGLVITARLHGGSETNIEPAMKIYEQAAKSGQIQSVYISNDAARQLLVSGEAWITPFFYGIMQPWVDEGAPLGYAVPKEGQIAFPLGFGMIKGTTPAQQKVATALINEMLSANVVKRWCDLTYGVPLVDDVKVMPKLAKLPAYQPEAVKGQINLNWNAIAKGSDAWTEEWNSRVKANLS
jgi:putative spermidine/putrescine transport system substrate-binding protein